MKRTKKERFLAGKRILPSPLVGSESVKDLVDNAFIAYNSGRLKEACHLYANHMLGRGVLVGLSLSGALTPAGLGVSTIIPLIEAGFIDWMVSTGANLYHDLHFAFNLPLKELGTNFNDVQLRDNDVVRIYDIGLGYTDTLMKTDSILDAILVQQEFQHEMGTAEFHYLLGMYADRFEKKQNRGKVSVLAAAYRAQMPIYCPSPGDSTLGMNAAGLEFRGNKLRFNPTLDVNETAAIVLDAKWGGGKSAVVIIGGGSPKNFMLQTEPHIQETALIKDPGHDFFLQITDARPDTGGLSGATPYEAVSWGKVDKAVVDRSVVCYCDTTIAFPILASYALSERGSRPLARLYPKRARFLKVLRKEYRERVERKSIKSLSEFLG